MTRALFGVAVIVTLCGAVGGVSGQEADVLPAWAYPALEPGRGRPPDDGTLHRRPGSDKAFTADQINDPFNPPDWYPDEHPVMPEVVAHGRNPGVSACGQCHMPHGMGHPESSSLAGLPYNYIVQQMIAYREGRRTSVRGGSMIRMGPVVTDEEIAAAAEYFSKLTPIKWIRVVETDTVPKTYVGSGNMRHAEPTGGTEPIGQRVIEIPEDSYGAELRDSHTSFLAYVPLGSLEKGKNLVTTGGVEVVDGKVVPGRTLACATCHGPDLKGLADIPSIAGRSPIYVVRQLMDIKRGARTGPSVPLMQAVVANLTDEDMVHIAAYTASLDP